MEKIICQRIRRILPLTICVYQEQKKHLSWTISLFESVWLHWQILILRCVFAGCELAYVLSFTFYSSDDFIWFIKPWENF